MIEPPDHVLRLLTTQTKCLIICAVKMKTKWQICTLGVTQRRTVTDMENTHRTFVDCYEPSVLTGFSRNHIDLIPKKCA